MITAAVGLAMSAVRAWTRLYTWNLPEALRHSRRDEIESDLWESVHDARPGDAVALQIWGRLLGGMVDDLRWRSDQVATMLPLALRFAITIALVAILGLWLVGGSGTPLPEFPAAPPVRLGPDLIDVPPPPPPPPPPCAPPGFPPDPWVKCVR
jgi:hypothetical protein